MEVHQLIRKVQRQEEKSQDRQKMKNYHQYCSSIERKYSPNTLARKQPQLKKALTIKHPAAYAHASAHYKNQKSVVSYG